MSNEIKVIGVDPAPSKDSTVFDGEKFRPLSARALLEYINGLDGNVLICWDAPLTSPEPSDKQKLYTRPIELFFQKKIDLPKGISVLGYAGCPHWTITQYVLGYPEVGSMKHTNEQEQYKLIKTSDVIRKDSICGRNVMEVHPALSMYLMLKETVITDWKYKGTVTANNRKNRIATYLEKLAEKYETLINKGWAEKEIGNDDDRLDAYIAWLLGKLWLTQLSEDSVGAVKLIGGDDGYFLLPDVEIGGARLSDKYAKFKNA